MQAQQIIDDVRRELLEYGAANFWSDAEIIRYLNRGQTDLVNRTRMLEGDTTITFVQGQAAYPLPSGFFSLRLLLHNVPDSNGNPNWKRIYPSNLEKIAQENPNFLDLSSASQERPAKYYIWGNTLYVVPAPNAESATVGRLFYKAKPATVSTGTDLISVDDSLAEGVTAFVLWKAWKKEGEDDKAAENKQTYFEYVGEGRRWLKKKSGDQRYRIDIDSPISFTGDRPGFSPF